MHSSLSSASGQPQTDTPGGQLGPFLEPIYLPTNLSFLMPLSGRLLTVVVVGLVYLVAILAVVVARAAVIRLCRYCTPHSTVAGPLSLPRRDTW